MSNLKYKTRGNSNPQGKPRVYFCCHKDDFEKFFKSISDEVLSLQNCSVWYKDGNDYVNEELLDDLKGMQLFVMPVTTNLLCKENEALDIEFKFAIKNHIPVLPLMQEQGLEQIFNQKCGELQFLDKHNTDITAISYEEKLKKYLESVLIGDEMAEKIRAAFDAYVFLSYRKKDRKYAQELMRLIHKNEFCRDIAIWYDEFLTPGENFNESIKEALQKSGLFVLTVTPNLVNEINYIMTTEYPMAKQEGKPILPAELVPTDREELSQKYEDIPTIADAHNDSELSDALLESIKKMAIKENDKNPEHNFFIGLAYLGGVDVEVDHEKALSLITSAAEAGLPEAMEKLVDMYRNGIGVKRDYFKAIEWQEGLVAIREKRYKQEKTPEAAVDYCSGLMNLGQCFEEVKDIQAAIVIYKKLENFAASKNISFSKRLLGISYASLGTMFYEDNKLDEAKEYCEKAVTIFESIIAELPTEESGRDLILTYSKMSTILDELSDLNSAILWAEKQMKVAEVIYNETKSEKSIHELISAYIHNAQLNYKIGYSSKAKEYCEKGLSFAQNIFNQTEDENDALRLSEAYKVMARIEYGMGNLQIAERYCIESLSLNEAVYSITESPLLKRRSAACYQLLSDITLSAGNITTSIKCCEEMIELFESLSKIFKTEKVKLDLATAYGTFGNVLTANDEFDRAKMFFQKELIIVTKIAKSSNTFEIKQLLATVYNNLGCVSELTNEIEMAKRFYMQSYKQYSELINSSLNVSDYHNLASVSFNIAKLNGNNYQYYKYAYDLWEWLLKKVPSNPEYVKCRNMVKQILDTLG